MKIIKWIKWILYEKAIHERIECEIEMRKSQEYIDNLYKKAEEIRNMPIPRCGKG